MNTFDNNVLSMARKFSSKLNPIIALIDRLIIERITPKTTAQACGGNYCSVFCGDYCGTPPFPGNILWVRYTAQPNCDGDNCWVNGGCGLC